jgi:Kdo2-lipid IVA lauroyltransferase/acyltransferase
MKNLRHGIELFFVRMFVSLSESLEDRRALGLGRCFGRILIFLLGSRKQVALKNMEVCSIGTSKSHREKILRRCFENFGMTIAEFARIKKYQKSHLKNKIHIENVHIIDQTIELGKGLLFLSGHYDNWELLIQAISIRGLKTAIVVRKQHNLLVNDFVNNIRESRFIEVIEAETSPREIIRAFKKGMAVAVLMDVWGGEDGHMIELFGQKVSTISGAIEIAVKHKTPIIIEFVKRQSNGRHVITISDSIIPGETEGLKTVDDIMKFYHSKLEAAIRDKPFFWLWTHKRFKNVVRY